MPLQGAGAPTWALTACAVIALLWLGVLFGVSFLATPIKFTAQSLTLPTALDVGRATFHLLVKVEWVAFALLLGAVASARFPAAQLVVLVILALSLAAQTFVLLPNLDGRVEAIIAGQEIGESRLHLIYVGVEILKLLTLAAAAIVAFRILRQAG
ncbi:MAG: hypothetical protein AB7O56_07155 [Bauldia sp.]